MNYKKKFSDFKNLKVLITGTTGFKGSWLAFWLSELGAKVIGVGLKPEKNSVLFKKLELPVPGVFKMVKPNSFGPN